MFIPPRGRDCKVGVRRRLILGRAGDAVDHQDLDGRLLRLEAEAELLAEGGD